MPTVEETQLNPENESHWTRLRHEFRVRPDTVYLNHGSFGIALNRVRIRRDALLRELETQPMDFFLRQYEPLLTTARQKLAEFVGTEAQNLAFVDNANWAMNVVANSVSLSEGDEVLMTDQSYGAVKRIFEKKARESGCELVEVKLPERIESTQQIVDLVLSKVTPKTKLAIISHIISKSAIILPVKEICAGLRERNVLICIDGPHAPLQVDVKLNQLGCDFYCASLHKWLCAPLGTGFIFVRPELKDSVNPPITGWGRLDVDHLSGWEEELIWLGTRNQTGALVVPEAIEFFSELGFETARSRMSYLASYAEKQLTELFATQTIASRDEGFYGSMAHVQLPEDRSWKELQNELWVQEGIEVPVWQLNGKWWMRVSCHLYNSRREIDFLVAEMETRI